jgi:hypothetical protein
VIGSYHQLFHIEKSFRMAKSDLQARPIYHRKHDSIEAHLTIVFAACRRLLSRSPRGDEFHRHCRRPEALRANLVAQKALGQEQENADRRPHQPTSGHSSHS